MHAFTPRNAALSMRRVHKRIDASMERVETLIIGGGQAGLVMSDMLSLRGCPHLLLERHRIAERWRTERWNGLRFQFPNWSVRLPGFPFAHEEPDGFATAAEIADYITAYADFIAAPIRCGIAVTKLHRGIGADGFIAETSDGRFEARNVVVATGPYQRPIIPASLQKEIGIFQVHASQYRDPGQLPPGSVLIVGSGASGAQIAEELHRDGRCVYLSVGRHRRMPRRYRGRDLIWWLATLGLDKTPVEKRGPDKSLPLITGAYGGHTIDFRQFAAKGITLLGRLVAIRNGVLDIAPDLSASLAHGDAAYIAFLDMVDEHVERNKSAMPEEPSARAKQPDPLCVVQPIRSVHLRAAHITTVIWATGYDVDFSWINLPVLDTRGQPIHRHGVANIAGLYFLGLQWLSKMNSSFLAGVADDAARLADHIAARMPAYEGVVDYETGVTIEGAVAELAPSEGSSALRRASSKKLAAMVTCTAVHRRPANKQSNRLYAFPHRSQAYNFRVCANR
jgi:putative flavoprotein involved in K+ transport